MPSEIVPKTRKYEVTDLMGVHLNANMFDGVQGDGVTDVAAPLLDAIMERRRLIIPPGRFLINSLLDIDVDGEENVCLEGYGDQSVIVLGDASAGLQLSGTPGSGYNNLILRNFTIEGASTNGSSPFGLKLLGVANFKVDNVKVICPTYRTFSTSGGTLTVISVSSGVATVETSSPHNVAEGDIVWLEGTTGETNLNDTYFCLLVLSPTQFTFPVYGDFPVANGSYNNAGMILRVPRIQHGIVSAAAQQGQFDGGRVSACGVGQSWQRVSGIGSNMAPRFGGTIDNCPLAAFWYKSPVGGDNGGADDGGLFGVHTTQGRYGVRVDNTGSGLVTVQASHIEYHTKIGLLQTGGRVAITKCAFYDSPDTSISIDVAAASDVFVSKNQCNGGIRFRSGTFSGRCHDNIFGSVPTWVDPDQPSEIYDTENVEHYSNRRFSGPPPPLDALHRMREPSWMWHTENTGGGDYWHFKGDQLTGGKYRIFVQGSGAGYEAEFTADMYTEELDSTGQTLEDDDEVTLKTTGTLPGGLSVTQVYYVVNSATNVFQLSTTPGGSPVDITSPGTGTHAAVLDHGAGVLMSGSEIFVPTSNTFVRMVVPDGAGGYKIAFKADVNGVQLPFGGTGVSEPPAKGDLLVGNSGGGRSHLHVNPTSDGQVLVIRAAAGFGIEWADPNTLVNGDITVESISFEGTADPAFPMIRRAGTTDKIQVRTSDNAGYAGVDALFMQLFGSPAIYLGGATSSHVALKRSSDVLQVRLGDDSDNTGIHVKTALLSGGSGVLLYLGGTSSSHVGLKRTSDVLQVKLADDSDFAGLHAKIMLLTGASGPLMYLGGTTSGHVALKRVSDSLQIRLADDSDFAGMSAKIMGLFGSGVLLYLGGTSSGDCSLKVSSGELQFRNGNDSGNCDVRGGDASFANVECRNFVIGSTQPFVMNDTNQKLTSASKTTMLGELNVYEITDVYNKTEVDAFILDLQDQIDTLTTTTAGLQSQIDGLVIDIAGKSNSGHTHGVSKAFEGDPTLEHSHSTDPD